MPKSSTIQFLRRKYFNPKGLWVLWPYNRYSKQIAKYAKENGITHIHNNTTAVLGGLFTSSGSWNFFWFGMHEIIVKPKGFQILSTFLMGLCWYDCDSFKCCSQPRQAVSLCEGRVFKSSIMVLIMPSIRWWMPAQSVTSLVSPGCLVIGMVGRVNAWKARRLSRDPTL